MKRPAISGAHCMRASLLIVALPALFATPLRAQTPGTRFACYVPGTGTVYLIKEPTTKQACTAPSHVQFSWVDGAGAVRTGDAAAGDLAGTFTAPLVDGIQGRSISAAPPADGQGLVWNATSNQWEPKSPAENGGADHGALSGLADDDHPQYLLANGLRNSPGGFAVSGTFGVGTLPAQGEGGRLMYSTTANAFRVGSVTAPVADAWDLPNLGAGSVAMGHNVAARGFQSIVLGRHAFANKSGAFVFATGSPFEPVGSDTKDEFLVHAEGGIVLRTSGFGSSCRLRPGSGALECSSDAAAKSDFGDVELEDVLHRVAELPITRWRYTKEADSVRHLGPTAQDFRAAFGLGEGDKHIGVLDAAGVSLSAAKALAARTAVLSDADAALRSDLRALRGELDRLSSERDDLRRRLAVLEASLALRTDASGSPR